MYLVDIWTKQETKTTKVMMKMDKYKLPKYCPYCGGKLKTDDKGDSVAMYISKKQIEKETLKCI